MTQVQSKTSSEVRNYLEESGIDPDTVTIFLQYHKDHPDIWKNFERLALEVIEKGKTKWSARAIFNVLRYELEIKSTSGEEYKINVNYSPYYARVFHWKYPQYSDFFRLRRITGLKSMTGDLDSDY